MKRQYNVYGYSAWAFKLKGSGENLLSMDETGFKTLNCCHTELVMKFGTEISPFIDCLYPFIHPSFYPLGPEMAQW